MSRDKPKRAGTAVIAIIVILGAAFLLLNMKFRWVDLKFFGGRDNPALPRDLNVLTIDIETGEVYYVVLKVGDSFPLENPKTKRRTLWEANVCYDEKIIFPGKPGTMVASCPHCHSQRVGGATKEYEHYEVRMPE